MPIGGGAMSAQKSSGAPTSAKPDAGAKNFRIRALTAGVSLSDFADTRAFATALEFLSKARQQFEHAGYTVETIRIALKPLLLGATDALTALYGGAAENWCRSIRLAATHGAVVSIGPLFSASDASDSLPAWAVELAQATKVASFSGAVASAASGVHRDAVMMAAKVIVALAQAGGGGIANFRFAAAACVPPGALHSFPVAYHEGPSST